MCRIPSDTVPTMFQYLLNHIVIHTKHNQILYLGVLT